MHTSKELLIRWQQSLEPDSNVHCHAVYGIIDQFLEVTIRLRRVFEAETDAIKHTFVTRDAVPLDLDDGKADNTAGAKEYEEGVMDET